MNPHRRTFLAQALASAALLAAEPLATFAAGPLLVGNVTGLYTVEVARVDTPGSTAAVAAAVRDWPGRVAVGGGRFSMGGQVAIRGGLHLDMRSMNALVWLKPAERRVRVQAGMRWRDLQDLLDPIGLAVMTMQSYANFTVGGSVSVNAHGRYVGHGPVGHSVVGLQLVLADGQVIDVDRTVRPELFGAAIGGYGAVGVITEIELALAENVRIERVVTTVPLDAYAEHFEATILGNPSNVLHNADLLPPDFDAPTCVTWRRTDLPLTDTARLVPRGESHGLEQTLLWALTELPGAARVRKMVIHPLLTARPAVRWLNLEASLDVAELEPRSRAVSTYALQEYFIPRRHFLAFARGLSATLRRHRVEAVNVSLRHSPADTVSTLPWAKEAVFSFVLFFKQRVHARARDEVGRWTRELVELALLHEGRYYLPYQLLATRPQFERAYPEAATLREIKAGVDPRGKFSNELWATYL